MEGRGAAKGNAEESTAGRTPGRETALTGLQRVRETAKNNRRLKFTALLHHITPIAAGRKFLRPQQSGGGGRGRRDVAGLREHPL